MEATQSTVGTRRVLLVEDDASLRETFSRLLEAEGYEPVARTRAADAKELLSREHFDAVVSEVALPDGDGLELLNAARDLGGSPPVILITAFGTVQDAIEGMRNGASDVLTKPLLEQELLLALERATGEGQLRNENRQLKERLGAEPGPDRRIGRDPRLGHLFDLARSVASTAASVLVTGERGTGKAILARAIHRLSNRADGPFVEVSCSALPETLAESELFGHVQGAFSGAHADKVGGFEAAHTGTLFLNGIGAAPHSVQVKLLRFIQERSFLRVGDSRARQVDVRLVFATDRNLEDAVRRGEFREDLLERINVVQLQVPALRERPADILPLARHFLKRVAEEHGRPMPSITAGAARRLLEYPWPGNVHELENALERALLLCRDEAVRSEDLPGGAEPIPGPGSPTMSVPALDPEGNYSLKELLKEPERRILTAALEACGGNRERAARLLGINRATLFAKLRKLDMKPPRARRSSRSA